VPGNQTTQLNRNKFEEQDFALGPAPISAWADGLRLVVQHEQSTQDKQHHLSFDLYMFPEPSLILNANPNRQAIYLKNWLLSRPAWIWRAQRRQVSTPPISPQMWRECLWWGLATDKPLVNSTHPRFPELKRMAAAFNCTLENNGSLAVPAWQLDTTPPTTRNSGQLEWRGQIITMKENGMPGDEVVREIIWELYELSFRVELLALDSLLMSKSMDSEGLAARQDRIGRLFYYSGNQNNFNLLNIEFPPDNCGLSSWNIRGRKNSILILANLMIGWSRPSMPTKISQLARTTEQRDLSNEEMVELEKEVAAFYCQTFYDLRGRAPITPHRLRVA
jgi:hypothetical protein